MEVGGSNPSGRTNYKGDKIMIKLTLQRQRTGDQGTFGVLVLPDKTVLHTGELPWRDNQSEVSCIPEGVYKGILTLSPRFKTNLISLQNVPDRKNILIHKGNYCGDTTKGFKSDVEGCILLGLSLGTLNNQDAVLASAAAVKKFYDFIGKDTIVLTVDDPFHDIKMLAEKPVASAKPLV